MGMTEEQLLAVETRGRALLLAAAAGSGKTTVLTGRIVSMLTDKENPVDPASLLVVTFTGAAADEMRTRINRNLSEIIEKRGAEGEDISYLRATVNRMQVCTMDAFSGNLVKENSHLCRIAPDYRIMNKSENAQLSTEVASAVAEEIFLSDGQDERTLIAVLGGERNTDKLVNAIKSVSYEASANPSPEDWLDSLEDKIALRDRDADCMEVLREQYLNSAVYALNLCRRALEIMDPAVFNPLPDVFERDEQSLLDLIGVCERGSWNDIIKAFSVCSADLKTRKMSARKAYKDLPEYETVKILRTLYCRKEDGLIDKVFLSIPATEEENEEDAAVLSSAVRALVSAVKLYDKRLFEIKQHRNMYSFSDISHEALRLLYDKNAPDCKTPLARKMSEGFYEILIDEYQDTNPAQEQLFACLSKNGENMFMVGDIKQSIYRFRLAAPDIFGRKKKEFSPLESGEKHSKIILGNNFRSRNGVTAAVNYIFERLMSEECGEIDYNDEEKLYASAKYFDSPTPDAYFHIVENSRDNETEAEAREAARIIKKLLCDGLEVQTGYEQIDGKDVFYKRKANYGDFCILLRNLKGKGTKYENILRAEGIPVKVDSGDSFFENTEIVAALSYLRAADSLSDDISMLSAMLSPAVGFTPTEAAEIKIRARSEPGKKYSLYNALRLAGEEGNEKCRNFYETVKRWHFLANSSDVGSLLRKIYEDTSLEACALGMPHGRVRFARLNSLAAFADKYSADSINGLSGFLRRIDAMIEAGDVPENDASSAGGDCVRIMTVHRSKGLEFPVVIVGGISSSKKGNNENSELNVNSKYGIGLKRREPENLKCYETVSHLGVRAASERQDVSEELRIYYVALTRAKEKLFLVAAPKNGRDKLSSAQAVLPRDGKIPPYLISFHYSEPWKWFALALITHPDAAAIRESDFITGKSEAPAVIRFISHDESENCDDEEDSALMPSADPAAVEAYKKRIRAALGEKYGYSALASCASKHAASSLEDEHYSSAYFAKSMPAFMYENGLTAADRGTATHLFLQYCDFAACEADFESEAERLSENGILDEATLGVVDKNSVMSFFSSPVYSEIKNADEVYREKCFTMALDAGETDPGLPENCRGEKTVVNGKIDILYIKDGKTYIVDYKTDRIKNIEELKTRYSTQMLMYKKAVKRAFGTDVSSCVLFSLHLGESISLG